MKRVKRILFLVVVIGNTAFAQNTFSPYSKFGIGDRFGKSMAHQTAIGDVGIGTPSVWHINSANPALLTFNKLTTFEFGVSGETRGLRDEVSSVRVGSGGFSYLSFAFPIITGKWTTNVGIQPYSSVNAVLEGHSTESETNPGEFGIQDTNFSGGINQVYFNNGVKITKNLSLGLRASYLFGSIESLIETSFESDGASLGFPTLFERKTYYSGGDYGVGASYSMIVSKTKALNIGLTYDFGNQLTGTRTDVERSLISGIEDEEFDEVKDEFSIPKELGIGVSWQKLNALTIGLDVKNTMWDKKAGFSNDDQEYRSTWTIGLGVEITPKYDDVDHYFNRVKYRIGFNFEQSPYIINEQTVNDLGMTFGTALPVRGVSALNLSCKIGRRGEITSVLVKENYIKLAFGATINDRWFVRRKYN